MKNYKKQIDVIYCDDNYFNKTIKPLFFETMRLTVDKNGPGKPALRLIRGNNAFYAHENLNADARTGKGSLSCPD